MFKSKLKANQLTFIDDTNTEYIAQDFQKQGFVAKTKEQLKQALTKLGANDGTIFTTTTPIPTVEYKYQVYMEADI